MNGDFASPPNIGPYWQVNASGIENAGSIYEYKYTLGSYSYAGNTLQLYTANGTGTLVQSISVTPGAMYRFSFYLQLWPQSAVDNDTSTNFFRARLGDITMTNITGLMPTLPTYGGTQYGDFWTAPTSSTVTLSFSYRVVSPCMHLVVVIFC
jgi:hypothetical protein